MRRFAIVPSLVLVAFAGACGGSGDSTGPRQSANLVTNGSFRATIGGTAWSAVGRAAASQSGTLLAISGVSGTYVITFGLGPFTGPGTYSLVYAPTANPPTASQAIVIQGSLSWGTSVQGGTGAVVITAYSATRVAGTFSFDAPAASGAGGTLHVTNGSFDFTP
jgi:hypothetical protein